MKLTMIAGGALLSLTLSQTAFALSCFQCPAVFPPRPDRVAPNQNQTVEVPSNFEIRRFTGTSPVEIPSDVGLSCTALNDLADGTESCAMTATSSLSFTLDVPGQSSMTFNVSSVADTEAPGVVEIVDTRNFGPDEDWNPNGGGVELIVRPAEAPENLSLEVEVALARGTEIISVPGQPGRSSGTLSVDVGRNLCHCGATYNPDDLPGASLRVRAVDLAGNRGPWSEVYTIPANTTFPSVSDEAGGCTCFGAGVAGPGAGGLLALAGMFMGLMRRRRA